MLQKYFIYIPSIYTLEEKGEYIMPESAISGISSVSKDYATLPEKHEPQVKPFVNSIWDAFNSANSGAPASTSHVA